MKKILLSFLALIAMVGMVNAQRAWAYDLQLTSAESSYTFAFKATTAGTATLVFTDAVGAEVGTVDLGAVEAGANTKTLALAEIPGAGNLNWAVKMTGAAIEEATLITSCNGFYMPFGVAVNNNPESKHFGKTYLSNPWHEGNKDATGFYVFDQELNLDATLFKGGSKVGYKPSNLTLANSRDAIQRMAVSPIDGTIAFAQWNSNPYAIYGMNPDALGGEVVALTDNAVLSQPVAVCYDKEGSLCLMNFDGKIDGKYAFSIHVIKDGEVTTFITDNNWVSVTGDNDLVSDGHGGFWVLNGKHDVSVGLLRHFTKSGEIDIDIIQGTDGYPTAFRRVRIGYDLKRDVLAIGGEGKIYLYNVEYDEEGKATLTKWMETPMYNSGKPAWNTDGIAFDYAGDLCAVSASSETFYKFALPTDNNTCTTPAPKAQVVVKELPVTTYTISVTAENGTVTGAGEYEEGATVTLEATANEGYEFVNWTKGEEVVSTANPYTFAVTENVTLVANFKKSVVTHDFYAEGVTVSEGGWSIDLAGSWDEQAFVLKLWQDNTQGFGTYAANAETGYRATLGVKELTPTAEGYYMQDPMNANAFIFQGTMTDGTDIYEVYLKGALASSTGTGELEAKNEVYFTYEDGEWMIEAFADDYTWGLMLAVSAETDSETGENLVYGEYVTDIEAGISEEVAGTCLLYFDDFSGCYVFKGGLATASGNIYPTLYASSLTLMANELQTGASWVGELADVDYYEVLMSAADSSWELELHARNCTGANGTYTIDVVDEEEGAYSTFMGSTIVTGELTIEDGMYEADVTTVDSEGNPAMSISVLAWAAAAEEYDIVITDATVTDNTSGYNIDLTGEWEGHDIKVEVCDELTAETILANFFFDGGIMNDGDQAEGEVTATVSEGVVTITGTFESGSGNVYNVTISGTLPVVEEPEVPTALDNIDSTVAPAKAIVNGQLVIIKNGVKFNAQGAVVK